MSVSITAEVVILSPLLISALSFSLLLLFFSFLFLFFLFFFFFCPSCVFGVRWAAFTELMLHNPTRHSSCPSFLAVFSKLCTAFKVRGSKFLFSACQCRPSILPSLLCVFNILLIIFINF